MAKTRIIPRILCALLTFMLVCLLMPQPVSAASVKLNHSSISIVKGSKATLKATSSGKVTWSSSNSKIVSVNSKGTIYAKAAGTCYIYAKSGSSKAKCKVKVVNGKLTVSQSTVYLDEGDSETITVTAKGSHSLKISGIDKSVAKAAWAGGFSGNEVDVRITGVGEGRTSFKIYMSKYTSISKTITVNVSASEQVVEGGGSNSNTNTNTDTTPATNTKLLVDTTVISIDKNKTSTFKVYADVSSKITAVCDNTAVATVSAPTWANGVGTYTVTGVKPGSAKITVSATDNASLTKTINVIINGTNDYYEVSDIKPIQKTFTDVIIEWKDGSTVKYMLVPSSNYDVAYTNTIFSKETGKYKYYEVYDAYPTVSSEGDKVSSFSVTISGRSVTRYILCPKTVDSALYQTAKASYTGTFEYYIIYNIMPVKKSADDEIKTWSASADGVTYTRYVLLPKGYSESRLEELKKSDSIRTGRYYAVSTVKPDKQLDTDLIYSFNYTEPGTYTSKIGYVLIPKDYDKAQRDTAIAEFTKTYEYYTVYSKEPVKIDSMDEVRSWTKVVNGTTLTRYVLLPVGFTNDILDDIKNKDLNDGSATAYYTVYTQYPGKISAADTVYNWNDPKTGKMKYMILPAGYSVVKRNDAVLADSGVVYYYTSYSKPPAKFKDTDEILPFEDAVYGKYYMLVPEGFTNEKVQKGQSGEYVPV
ncbi:MAG: Ig-like domain-containing protein [Oscillospiraceae bacterium]|nr:Ig-like domain-containing protein [Oscillospiraceae bacterium]